jgi:OCT family organic cation transporter-like MFS transporter 4/5
MMNLPYLLTHPDYDYNNEDYCENQVSENSHISNPAYEWNLICSHQYKRTLIYLFYFLGLGIGTYIISYLANRFGRKPVTIVGLIMTSITQFVSTTSTNPEVFMVLTLVSGVFVGGTTMTSFIYIHECVDGEFRNIYAGIIFAAWGLGMAFMSIINWVVSEWRIHFVIIGIANVVWVPFLLRFHESPRFLASNQGRYARARFILNCIASYNKKQPFTEMLEGEKVIGYQEANLNNPHNESSSSASKYSFVPISQGIVSVTESELKDVKRYTCCDLLRLRSLRKTFSVMMYIWFVLSMSYYGVVFSIPHYMGSPHLNGFIMALAETGSSLAMSFLLNRIGRQLAIIINLGGAGVCCLMALAFIHSSTSSQAVSQINKVLQIVLISIARFAIAAVRLISYIYAVECFPTSVRSIVFGVLGLISLFGSLFSPLVIMLGSIITIHPLFFIGLFLVTASFFACLLGETLGKNMEDYVEEEKEQMRNPSSAEGPIAGSSSRKFQKMNEDQVN